MKINKKKIENVCNMWNNSSEGEYARYQWKSYNDLSENLTSYFTFLEELGKKIDINGYEGIIFDNGYITIPFEYDDYKSILIRDPDNVFALKEKIDKSINYTAYSIIYNPQNEMFEDCKTKRSFS